MCTVCGCAGDGATIEGHDQRKDHHHDHGHQHDHHHHSDGAIDYGAGAAGVHVAGQSQTRLIEIEQDILSKNDALAAANRRRFQEQGIIALNMMSSPGSGKTTLLVETLKALKSRPVAVIEGDQQTSNDAARIRETGTAAIQVNTGKGCHLDADMVGHAAAHLEMQPGTLLFIENVGNLVCPAAFDLGETRRVVLASVTEGEDKPLKYPQMFAAADAMIITKTDLLPHIQFDVDLLVENARKVQPRLDVVSTSATGGPGIKPWLTWLTGLTQQFQIAAE